jgi:hypothetical protein
MTWLARLLGIRPASPLAAYRCAAAQCNSSDLIIARDVEQLVPGGQCPERIVVGYVGVCARCGQPTAITRDGIYPPALVPTAPSSEPAKRRDPNGPQVHARWPGKEPGL